MRLFLALFISMLVGTVHAEPFQARATADASIRAGILDNDPVISTIDAGMNITVIDCVSVGCLVETRSGRGWMPADVLQVNGQSALNVARAARLGLIAATSPDLRAEGDSYMDGAYGIALRQMLAQVSGRRVDSTAKGQSTLQEIHDRILSSQNRVLLKDVTIIWDGSTNGITTASEYADIMQEAIAALGHDHFIIVPALHGAQTAEVAAEFKRRWPDNVLDWRDVLGDYSGTIPTAWLAEPNTDQVHLGAEPLGKMADAIWSFVQSKGW